MLCRKSVSVTMAWTIAIEAVGTWQEMRNVYKPRHSLFTSLPTLPYAM